MHSEQIYRVTAPSLQSFLTRVLLIRTSARRQARKNTEIKTLQLLRWLARCMFSMHESILSLKRFTKREGRRQACPPPPPPHHSRKGFFYRYLLKISTGQVVKTEICRRVQQETGKTRRRQFQSFTPPPPPRRNTWEPTAYIRTCFKHQLKTDLDTLLIKA